LVASKKSLYSPWGPDEEWWMDVWVTFDSAQEGQLCNLGMMIGDIENQVHRFSRLNLKG
jgi:hypothetical protein